MVYDVETTGSRAKSGEPDVSKVSHPVSLCALLIDAEETVVSSLYSIIYPDGKWDMHPKAQEVHGISVEMAIDCGIPADAVLGMFNWMAARSTVHIAYNARFDHAICDAALRRCGFDPHHLDVQKRRDLMQPMTAFCKLPNTRGYSDYKWPKLEEAYEIMFGEPMEGAHNAFDDVTAAARLAFEAQRRGVWDWNAV